MKASAPQTIRLPLQTGGSALRSVLFAQIGAAIFVAGCCTMMVSGLGFVQAVVGVVVLTILLRQAWRREASDVLLSDDAIEVAEGPRNLLYLPWLEIGSARVDEDRTESVTVDGQTSYLRKLIVSRKNGVEETLAESIDEDEQRSMAVLARAIEARVSPQPDATPASASVSAPSVEVVSCPACRAPVAPCAAENARCTHCNAVVPMPADIRDRVKRSQEITATAARLDTAIGVLLRQPGAAPTNRVIARFAVCTLVAPILMGVLLLSGFGRELLLLVSVLIVMWSFAHTAVAHRMALRTLMTGFGAGRRTSDGAIATCRRCGAPLPEPPEGGALVRCVYCDAQNVLGLELLPIERDLAADDLDAESALAAQYSAERSRKVSFVLAAGVLLSWTILHLLK